MHFLLLETITLIHKGIAMEDKPKEMEILEAEEFDDDDFFQLSQEVINKNTIYSNMDLQFNRLMMK